MAIFWKYIKGLNSNENKERFYTWLNWGQHFDATFNSTPQLIISQEQEGSSQIDLGHIITSKATGQTIEDGLNINKYVNTTTLTAKEGTVANFNIKENKISQIKEEAENKEILNCNYAESTMYLKYNILLQDKTFKITNSNINLFNVDLDGNVNIKNGCRATYFSALSDKRAKKNILPLHFRVLPIINNLSVYTFNYKTDDYTNYIGIMAQDLLNTPLKSYIIDNPNASGKQDNYMSIKEDKLVYVLLQAIKEQQEQIQELQEQIKILGGTMNVR